MAVPFWRRVRIILNLLKTWEKVVVLVLMGF